MANSFQNVVTYNRSMLAYLQATSCFLYNANKRFKEFNTWTINYKNNYGGASTTATLANRGATVSWDLPPRTRAAQLNGSLDVSAIQQDMIQRVDSMTLNRSVAHKYLFTDQDFILNLQDYMDRFGKAAAIAMGIKIETDMATDIEANTYRVYGDGITAINSYEQLAMMLAKFRSFDTAPGKLKVFLPIEYVPPIIGSGLNNFVMKRNEEIAQTWSLGEWNNCEVFQVNTLPVHISGAGGILQDTLTLTGVNGAGNQLTFSGASTNVAQYAKAGDILRFDSNNGLVQLGWTSYVPTSNLVTVRVTDNAQSSGGNVTIPVAPALVYDNTVAQLNEKANINMPLTNGMTAKLLQSHKLGVVISGDSWFVGMPTLPTTSPFASAVESDPATGASMRTYHGARLETGTQVMAHDALFSHKLAGEGEYAMRIAFPIMGF